MLFSSYLRLKFAKYFLYFIIDLLVTYFVVRLLTESVFEWALFAKVYLLVLQGLFARFICAGDFRAEGWAC